LFDLSDYGPTTSIVLFSGPYGKQAPIHEYENIVMMATGFGIAAHLPYLKKLIHDHHSYKTSIRRIHLIWQMGKLGMTRFFDCLTLTGNVQMLASLFKNFLTKHWRRIKWMVTM
jgi:hypothetical protein